MSDHSLSAQSRTFPRRVLACGRELWRQISNPLALGLLALAVAVTVWGSAYKLSLYSVPHGNSSSRIPAKLWIEHRFGFAGTSSSAIAPHFKMRPYAAPGASALRAATLASCWLSFSGLLLVTARPRAIPFFRAAIPLRSPPFTVSF